MLDVREKCEILKQFLRFRSKIVLSADKFQARKANFELWKKEKIEIWKKNFEI